VFQFLSKKSRGEEKSQEKVQKFISEKGLQLAIKDGAAKVYFKKYRDVINVLQNVFDKQK
jgi:hypothetical protein